MKNIGLVFDSNYKVGGGHFWRCFNLAKSIKNYNYKFFFISNTLDKFFIKLINKENFKYINLSSLNNQKSIISKIKKFNLDVLITDYYKLKPEAKKNIKKNIKLLIVIDDFIHKKHFSDIYINNNFLDKFSKNKIKKLNPNTKLLLGPKYFILDKFFINKKNKEIKKNKIINIFCFFGSSDPSNQTLKFLKSIENINQIKVNILIGKLNKNFKKLKKKFNYKNNIKFFYNIPNNKVVNLLKTSNIAVGSGGINMLERLFLGIPSIIISTADNQKNSIKKLVKLKLIIFLGESYKVKMRDIRNIVKKLILHKNKLATLNKKLNLYFNDIKKECLLSKKLSLIINNLNL